MINFRPYYRRSTYQAGFTLLELMLVMTLLAVLTAMVSPVFKGTFENLRSENAVRDLVATMEYAQTRAITDAKEYRLYLAPEANAYWLEKGVHQDEGHVIFEKIVDTAASLTILPDSVLLAKPKALRDKKTRRYYVSFYPNGLCDSATLSLFADDDVRYVVSTTGTRVHWVKAAS